MYQFGVNGDVALRRQNGSLYIEAGSISLGALQWDMDHIYKRFTTFHVEADATTTGMTIHQLTRALATARSPLLSQ